MYTILMKKDKSLRATNKVTLYQREKLVDKIQFLIPQTYEDKALSDFIVALKYTDTANVAHAEILTVDEELYNEKLRYVLPVDTKLTKFAGDIIASLSFIRLDEESGLHEEVLHSGDIKITITPKKDLYAFVADESLEVFDQMLLEITARAEAMNKTVEEMSESQVDDLTLSEEGLLQVMANGTPVGQGVNISDELINDALEDGVPVVDFSVIEPEGPSEVDNVVEF